MKKTLKIAVCILLGLVLLVGGALGGVLLYSFSYSIPPQEAQIINTTGLIQAHGRSLYDASGKAIQLRGINAGQILLQEGWMSPFAVEPLYDDDGNVVTDGDGNIQYPEFTEAQFRSALKSNPNLQDYPLEALLKTYWDSFFTEEDFRIIKEELGLNAIRLPFYYLNILNEDLTPKPEEEAFAYLDWFLTQAASQELYVILDLHGAPGSQNGREHSGTDQIGTAGLWDSEEYIAATVELWSTVSRHYTETAPELGKWVATYDIMNEPEDGGVTTPRCWAVFDRIYQAIRANGDSHVITMEACWDASRLPDPAEYGWENIQYEQHWYNWWSDKLPTRLLYAYYDLMNLGRDYDVPVLIGEFTLFEDRAAWGDSLSLFDGRNYSWTIWSYKTTVTGWWTSSWGVYTCQLNLSPESGAMKCNPATCTYEEFLAACRATATENCATGTLYEVLMTYKEK